MLHYIDPVSGNDQSDGASPETARRDYRKLKIAPGDTILFKRGTVQRDWLIPTEGTPEAPTRYGAYGEGNAPAFYGSVDTSSQEDWKEVRENVWEYTKPLDSEVCNFIFDNGRVGATLRWDESSLQAPGDWYDSRMGMGEKTADNVPQRVLLYSVGNPGKVFTHIECALRGRRCLVPNKSYTVFEDLSFFGSGVHVFSGGAHDVTIRRCSFCFIGGAVWNKGLKIRFGNAIEFWNTGYNITIEDCCFNNIYDSAITQQGAKPDVAPARNIVMRHNLFIACGMGAYEGRDLMTVGCEFSDNICLNAGYGFTAFGDTKPRNSEIYPLPMGHHIFMWRITEPVDGGSFIVKNNIFRESTGANIYAFIDDGAAAQMHLSGNTYFTTETLLNRLGSRHYTKDDTIDYDEGGKFEDTDATALAEKWFSETNTDRTLAKLFTDETVVAAK